LRARIVTVCTGNVCRSPVAEVLLRDELARRGVDAEVSSAGIIRDGMPIAPEMAALLRSWGLDGDAHRSRLLDERRLTDADLVLGMAREHVREAVLHAPDVLPRAFTLKELVRRGGAIGPRLGDEPLADWLARAGADRQPTQILGASAADDITDPIGRRPVVYDRVADEIRQLVASLAALAWPRFIPAG
jgi:protein-tyrosine phosphatase